MKRRFEAPELAHGSLRDHAQDERVDRIWKRLGSEIAGMPERPRSMLWWAPAAVVIVFGAGVFVGARWLPARATQSTALTAEPAAAAERAGGPEPTTFAPGPEREQNKQKPRRHVSPPLATSPIELLQEPTPEPVPLAVPVPESRAPRAPEWQELAELGEYRKARGALDQAGGFDAALASATPEQLDALAEVARYTGMAEKAIQALRQLVDRFPGHESTPEAAWTLGGMLERAGDRVGAAAAYATYQRLCWDCGLAEDALGRQVDLALERKDFEHGRRLVEQYAKQFPKGRRLREFRQQLAKLTGQKPGGRGGAAPAPEPEENPDDEPGEESPRPARPAP